MAGQTPEDRYGWLYGDDPSGTAHLPPPPPDAPGRSATYYPQGDARPTEPAGPADLPPPNLPPPGSGRRTGSGGGPRRPRLRIRRTIRIVGLLVVAWIVFLVGVPIWALNSTSRVDAEPEGDRPGDQPGTTYLMVGSDSRRGLSEAEQVELSTGPDGGGAGRTDTIMLLHVGSGPTTLLSIPRDSLVEVPGYGRTKINAAYAYGGPKLLVQTIEQSTGIRVDDYIEVGFGGLVKVVDSVGGIEICPENAIQDPDAGLDIPAGCQNADGITALGYSRSRHTYTTQDIQRVQAQREVLGAIADEVKSPWTVLNPVRYVSVTKGASSSLQIGENVGPFSLAKFARALGAAMGGDGLNCTVPLRDFAVTWDPERAPQMFDRIINDQTDQIADLCTPDGLPPA